jgi:DNA gyrase/topoisomerase IV subunit A
MLKCCNFRLIFNPHDDAILKYMLDDNQKIEPEWYMPIIPMVLVNGADGIGTGWMTKIPNYNPREIVEVKLLQPHVMRPPLRVLIYI